jgi:hypothetical protein
MKVAMRQMAVTFAQLEKARLVAKLAAARKRKRETTGQKVEGRKSHAEARPEVVALARRLYRRNPKCGVRRSFRAIAAALEAEGHLNTNGKRFSPSSVRNMLV